jgi:hypothetical protein
VVILVIRNHGNRVVTAGARLPWKYISGQESHVVEEGAASVCGGGGEQGDEESERGGVCKNGVNIL